MDLDLHIPAGILIIFIVMFCLMLNAVVLSIIAKYPEFYRHPPYKFMLLMGVFDVSQGIAHFMTGFFTIFQWDGCYWIYQILSVMISPSYESYIFVTVLLAFHRFILFCTSLEKSLFSPAGTWVWCLIVTLVFSAYTAVQLSGNVYTYYDEHDYRWTYDYSLPWTANRTQFVFYYQICGILIAWLLYLLIAVKLLSNKNDQTAAARYKANRIILFQAFVITVYCTFQNVLWHKLENFTGPSRIANFLLNTMWIGNSGLSAFLCLLINRKIQRAIIVTVKKKMSKSGWM